MVAARIGTWHRRSVGLIVGAASGLVVSNGTVKVGVRSKTYVSEQYRNLSSDGTNCFSQIILHRVGQRPVFSNPLKRQLESAGTASSHVLSKGPDPSFEGFDPRCHKSPAYQVTLRLDQRGETLRGNGNAKRKCKGKRQCQNNIPVLWEALPFLVPPALLFPLALPIPGVLAQLRGRRRRRPPRHGCWSRGTGDGLSHVRHGRVARGVAGSSALVVHKCGWELIGCVCRVREKSGACTGGFLGWLR